jgi:hypothetical protein
MNTFHEKGFVKVSGAIRNPLLQICYDYLLLKSKINDSQGDAQVPGAISTFYADPLIEVLLSSVKGIVEHASGLSLYPTYSYGRVYVQGNDLKIHKDRPACEISATLCLGSDVSNVTSELGYGWPIFMGGESVDCHPGDLIVYKGPEVDHWREPFKGITQAQVFLHYVNTQNPDAEKLKYDGRPNLGYPASAKL